MLLAVRWATDVVLFSLAIEVLLPIFAIKLAGKFQVICSKLLILTVLAPAEVLLFLKWLA
jgi:hypothetical protein